MESEPMPPVTSDVYSYEDHASSLVLAKIVFLPGRIIMWHLSFRGLVARLSQSYQETRALKAVVFPCLILMAFLLASCGSATAAVTPSSSPEPTRITTPIATSTQKPKPAPKVVPTATPVPVQAAPAILDLRPSSMSIVGHLDCNKNGVFVCFARVLSRSSNQSNLNWSAFTNVPGNIGFSPASGVLTPGQSVLITITVPFNACTAGLFFFRGPVNTHTITWAC
jgi:hypothetical protein